MLNIVQWPNQVARESPAKRRERTSMAPALPGATTCHCDYRVQSDSLDRRSSKQLLIISPVSLISINCVNFQLGPGKPIV